MTSLRPLLASFALASLAALHPVAAHAQGKASGHPAAARPAVDNASAEKTAN